MTRARPKALAVRVIEAKTRRPFVETIAQLRSEGKSFREIGRKYDMAHATIWRHWKRAEERHAGEPVA